MVELSAVNRVVARSSRASGARKKNRQEGGFLIGLNKEKLINKIHF